MDSAMAAATAPHLASRFAVHPSTVAANDTISSISASAAAATATSAHPGDVWYHKVVRGQQSLLFEDLLLRQARVDEAGREALDSPVDDVDGHAPVLLANTLTVDSRDVRRQSFHETVLEDKLLPARRQLGDVCHLLRRVVDEVEAGAESAAETRVGVEEHLHRALVPGHYHKEVRAVILHLGQQRADDLAY